MDAETQRLPALRPEQLDAEQRAVYDALTTGARGRNAGGIEIAADGSLAGPFNAMLHAPQVGGVLQQVGAALRYSGVLPGRARELAVLLVAAHHRSAYEWYAHAAIADRLGIEAELVDAIRTGAEPRPVDPVERAVVAATRELLDTGDLTDASWAAARAVLDEAAVVELVTLVGYYGLLALQLRVFRVSPPPAARARK